MSLLLGVSVQHVVHTISQTENRTFFVKNLWPEYAEFSPPHCVLPYGWRIAWCFRQSVSYSAACRDAEIRGVGILPMRTVSR